MRAAAIVSRKKSRTCRSIVVGAKTTKPTGLGSIVVVVLAEAAKTSAAKRHDDLNLSTARPRVYKLVKS